jgi:hypothetical protein
VRRTSSASDGTEGKVSDTEVLGLRVQLTRAVSLLMQPTTERPDPAILAAALREVVTASESALGRLSSPS